MLVKLPRSWTAHIAIHKDNVSMRIAAPSFLEAHHYYQDAKRFLGLIKRLANEFVTLRGPYLAAAIAFYAFLSLFPLTIGLVTLLHIFSGHTDFEAIIVEGLSEQIPVLTEASGPTFVEQFITETSDNPAVTSTFTGLVLFVAALGVFGAIRESVNIMWGLRRRRSFFMRKVVEATLLLGGLTLLFASLIISTVYTFIDRIGERIWDDPFGISGFLLGLVNWLAPLAITCIVFTFLYVWLPHTRLRIKEVVPVALLAAGAYELAKLVFIVFVHNLADRFFSFYGSVATLMMFFIFIYVQSIILLAGAMLCAKWVVYLRMRRAATRRREISGDTLSR